MSPNDNQRTRTITWHDPAETARNIQTMSGLDYFQAMLAGSAPNAPIGNLMDFFLTEASSGSVVFTVTPAEFHYNPIGVVHGGLAATLLDSAMSCAVQTMLSVGVGYTTMEIKVNYVRPITVQSGRLRAIGQVIHMGRRMATAEGKLIDDNDKLYAHGTTTCMIFQPQT
jgi:uncharacterized protein (TIGR00369 family)